MSRSLKKEKSESRELNLQQSAGISSVPSPFPSLLVPNHSDIPLSETLSSSDLKIFKKSEM